MLGLKSKKRGGAGDTLSGVAESRESASTSTANYQTIPKGVMDSVSKYMMEHGSALNILSLSGVNKEFKKQFPIISSPQEYKNKVNEFLEACKAVYDELSIVYHLTDSIHFSRSTEIILETTDTKKNKDAYPKYMKFIITSSYIDRKTIIKNIEVKTVIQMDGIVVDSRTEADINFKNSKIHSIITEYNISEDEYKKDNFFMFVIGYLLSNNFKRLISDDFIKSLNKSLNPRLKESLKQAFTDVSNINSNTAILYKNMIFPKLLLVINNYLTNAKNHMNAKFKNLEKTKNMITYDINSFTYANKTKKFTVDIPLDKEKENHYFIEIVFND
jgi:hypothetical protein